MTSICPKTFQSASRDWMELANVAVCVPVNIPRLLNEKGCSSKGEQFTVLNHLNKDINTSIISINDI